MSDADVAGIIIFIHFEIGRRLYTLSIFF